jgi:hypothetical protein
MDDTLKRSDPEVKQSAGKERYAKAHPRTPLPGNEVEFEEVKVAADLAIERVGAWQTEVLQDATNPKMTGLFSGSLRHSLSELAATADNAARLLCRLHALCGAKMSEDRQPMMDAIASRATSMWSPTEPFADLTPDEAAATASAIIAAVKKARASARAARLARAQAPDGCPKCGGGTFPCRANGDWRWLKAGTKAPARCCRNCGAVTVNAPPDTANVVALFKRPRS